MSKLSFFVCAFLLVSVACDRKADREAQKKLERARARCVASINRSSGAVSQKYHSTVEQLATLEERDAMFEVVREATDKLNALVPVARVAATDEVAFGVETAFGEAVDCREDLAVLVSEITYEASKKLDAFFNNPQ